MTLAQRPSSETKVRKHECRRQATGECEVINLREVRIAAGMSQNDIAVALGMSKNGQRTVSQIEARADWLLSSLAAYIKAAGRTAELVVKVSGEEIRFIVA